MYKVFITQRGIKAPSGLKRTVKKAVRAAAKLEGKKGGVSLLLTDDENIRRLNREFRDNDTTTDVLSFPSGERYFLGDIAISVPCAKRQAQHYGHTVTREAAFLTVHAMLHLLGYDHLTKADDKVMRERQEKILQYAGFLRNEV